MLQPTPFPLPLQPLSVELGPGLLTTIFDGIQRPLKAIALSSGDCFIPRGVDVPALNRKTQWEFNPGKVKVIRSLHPAKVGQYFKGYAQLEPVRGRCAEDRLNKRYCPAARCK